jgi:hypothetical protein
MNLTFAGMVFITFWLFAGCAAAPELPQPVVVKDNKVKDDYIDKLESVASDAAAGIKAVKETLIKDSISFKILENQEIRLSGIKPPSVVKLDEYRSNITNNDTKAAAKDKVEAEKVDEQTTELYGVVALLDSQLAEEQLRRAEADRVAERALKNEFRTSMQNYGLYLTLAGILVMAFLKSFFKSGVVMCLGGIVLTGIAYWMDSPEIKWIMGITAALVALEILWLSGRYGYKHFVKKDLPKEQS